MKRWAIGSIAFFATFGFFASASRVTRVGPNLPATPAEQTTVPISPFSFEDSVKPEVLEVIDDKTVSPDKFSCQILETGQHFHADQIAAKSGETWLGVFNENGNFSVRPAKLKVDRVPDEVLHGPGSSNKGKLTGKSVSVSDATEPLFLVKNSDRIHRGPLTTLFVGERENWKSGSTNPTYLDKNFNQSYELGGKTYELKVVKAQNIHGDPILALLLEGDGKRQLLHTLWTRGEGEYGERHLLGSVGTLYWAGDIDRDNKPDFYLSLYAHETIYEAYLLLSSEADDGDLVKKAALFSTSGCG